MPEPFSKQIRKYFKRTLCFSHFFMWQERSETIVRLLLVEQKKTKEKKRKIYLCRSFNNVIWGLVAAFTFIFHYLKFLLSQVNSKAFHEAFFSLQRVTMFHCLQRERVKEHPFFWIAYNPSAVPSWQCYSGLCNLQQLVQSVFRVKKAFWISSSFSIIHSWVADCLLNTNNYQCFCSI